MFYVLTKDLMDQAYETLSGSLNEPIGRIGGGYWDIQKINVCTVQTAIRAVNLKNQKFKISDYKFDEEDLWDKKQVESADKLDNLKKLLRATKGLYFDECITGDSIVYTEFGAYRMDEVNENDHRFVVTHDGDKIVYKVINKTWDKGLRTIYKVMLENKAFIKGTVDHTVLTDNGWKKIGNLIAGEKMLFFDFKNNSQKIISETDSVNWVSIQSVEELPEKENVYDIEVQDVHCFFANGIMVHNCHHAAAKTVSDTINASPNAFWRYGGSATPYREDGAEILLQALFGRKIVDISASTRQQRRI